MQKQKIRTFYVRIFHVGCGDFRRTAVSVQIFHVGCSVYDAPQRQTHFNKNRICRGHSRMSRKNGMSPSAIPYNALCVNLIIVGCGDFRRTAVSVQIFHVGCSVYDAPQRQSHFNNNRICRGHSRMSRRN